MSIAKIQAGSQKVTTTMKYKADLKRRVSTKVQTELNKLFKGIKEIHQNGWDVQKDLFCKEDDREYMTIKTDVSREFSESGADAIAEFRPYGNAKMGVFTEVDYGDLEVKNEVFGFFLGDR